MTSNSNAEAVKLLTLKQFREIVPISPATTFKLLAVGKLRPTRIGGRTFISTAEVERFLSEAAANG